MKKTLLILLAVSFSTLFAQQKFTEFKVGIHNPESAKTGFWGGLTFGRAVDENIGVGLAVDFYRSSYTKETKVGSQDLQGNITEDEIEVSLEQSTTLVPIFFNIQYQGPMTRFLNLRITAGLGYEFLWSSYQNYYTNDDKTRFYNGFGWHVDAGVAYELSRASDIFAQVTYHSAAPSRDRGETAAGLPTRKEVDMSGIGLRLGIRIYSFGF